jgi:para-nitrobenzyl esterase
MSKCLFATAILGLVSVAAAQDGPRVKVTGGEIQGKLMTAPGGAIFKGIPFAAPPVGDMRWKEPGAVKPWSGVRQTVEYAATCPQSDSGWNKLAASKMNEDCLFLNIWAPEWPSKSKKAVMLWIHGGGNTGGSALGAGGIEPPFDGESLARHGVVLVTINYRLGLFGFIGHPELTAESPHHASGAYGLLDQLAAMKWVKENIEKFGGDPANVTVFGQSAGAQNLSILLTSPLAKGLFAKVILESGTPMINDKRLQTPAQMEDLGVALAKAVKAPDSGAVKYMRSLPAADIIAASADFRKNIPQGMILDVGMDGYVVPVFSPQVYRDGKELPVAMIVGNNGRESGGGPGRGAAPRPPEEVLKSQIENGYKKYPDLQAKMTTLYGLDGGTGQPSTYPPYGTPLAQLGTDESFRCQATMLANWHSAIAPTFEYEFTAGTDEHPPLHSGELASVFGVLFDWASDPKFHKLSEQMEQYWTNFAKNGDPNGAGLPQWPKHDARSHGYIELSNEGPAAKANLRAATCGVYAEKLNRDIDARKGM